MLPILRSRPSQMLVALLCALVLSRMPAPMLAEDAFASFVKIEESTVITVIIAPTVSLAVFESAIAISVPASTRSDAPNHSFIEHSILRL